MGSAQQPLRNIGIYHNLPNFDPSITNLTAIVTGANGISGFCTMRALLDSPQRWTKIYALSRRAPPESMMALLTPDQRSRVQHVSCDFLSTPSEIATSMTSAGVQATHIFFYSYVHLQQPPDTPLWSNAEELVKVNTALLTNFLSALPQANIRPRRVLLQTGAKNYGVHLGRPRTPAQESDPQPTHLAPNFYYPQETALFQYCHTQSCDWNVVMPAWIIGATTNAAMNALHPFAIYAAVQSHRSLPIAFPGDWTTWQQINHHSTARLTGYLSEWLSLEPACANHRFNATDTSPFVMDRFYTCLARWFNVTAGVTPPPTSPTDPSYTSTTGPSGPDTPLGYGPPTTMTTTFSLVSWAKDPVNHAAWKSLMHQSKGTHHELTHDPFDDPDAHFSCGDAVCAGTILSMDKARKMGWSGYVDTMESVFEMYREMGALGMVPQMTVEGAGREE